MEMKLRFLELREKYRQFYNAVYQHHRTAERPHQGHGMDHDVTVAQLCLRISPNEHIEKLAWLAGILHSTDRTVERGNTGKVAELVEGFIQLLPDSVSSYVRALIHDAVMRHAEMNRDDQTLVQQVLMDADRLANLQAAVIMRCGQHYSKVPALELEWLGEMNPNSTYNEPCSVLDDVRGNVKGYMPQFRLQKAIKLAEFYKERNEKYVIEVQGDYRMLGLHDIEL